MNISTWISPKPLTQDVLLFSIEEYLCDIEQVGDNRTPFLYYNQMKRLSTTLKLNQFRGKQLLAIQIIYQLAQTDLVKYFTYKQTSISDNDIVLEAQQTVDTLCNEAGAYSHGYEDYNYPDWNKIALGGTT